MDLEILGKGLVHTNKKKKWLIILGAMGFIGYGSYRVYTLPSVVRKRQRLLKLFGAFVSIAEMMSDSADAIGIISKDLKQFLVSDTDQIPPSLMQISKISNSSEFSESLATITRALTVGIMGGYQHVFLRCDSNSFDRALDRLFSDAGSSFASVVVGSFARNLVMALFSEWRRDQRGSIDKPKDRNVPGWIDIISEDKFRDIIGDCIQAFVSTAVTVYLEKTMTINTYDEIFAGLTNPKHDARVKDVLVSVCKGAVETLVETSHHVWSTNSVAASKMNSTYSVIEFEDGKGRICARVVPTGLSDKNQDSGWMRKMSSTLSNRKFVLDITGVVTFEAVRSFLEILIEKWLEFIKRSADVVQKEVVDRGVEAIRYAGSRSSAVTAVCFNIVNSPWTLMPY